MGLNRWIGLYEHSLKKDHQLIALTATCLQLSEFFPYNL